MVGKHEEAIKQFNLALKLDAEHVNSLHNKGVSLAALQKYEEALVAYDLALQIDPSYEKLYMAKGYVLMQEGEHTQAKTLFDTFLQLSQEKNQELVGQVELWLKALDSGEIQEDHYQYLEDAKVAMDKGDGQSAIQLLDKFLSLYPADPGVLVQRAYIAAQMGQNEAAQQGAANAQKLAPNDPWGLYFLAKIELAFDN